MLDVNRERNTASVEMIWQTGAQAELPVRVKHSALNRSGTRPDLIDVVPSAPRKRNGLSEPSSQGGVISGWLLDSLFGDGCSAGFREGVCGL